MEAVQDPVRHGGWSVVSPSPERAFAILARNTLPETGRCAGVGGCSSVDTLARTRGTPSGSLPLASWWDSEKSRVFS